MPLIFYPPDESFATSSGSNLNYTSSWSYFDHSPASTMDLTIAHTSDDDDPRLFEVGGVYDLIWQGLGGGAIEDANIIRSDFTGPGQGAIVFQGINAISGELDQIVWSPGFDLTKWYNDVGGKTKPPSFWTFDQHNKDFEYVGYAKGTLIQTPDGPREVESLRIGDLIDTQDHGPQPIRWLRADKQQLDGVSAEDMPLLISAGSLGPGRPSRDLVVSPLHRIVLGGFDQATFAFGTEVFAPAKALKSLRGVRPMMGKRSMIWIRFAFDRHAVVDANGCKAESLLLEPMALRDVMIPDVTQPTAIFGTFCHMQDKLNGATARPCLSASAVRRRLQGPGARTANSLEDEFRKWDADALLERAAAARELKRRMATTTCKGDGARG
ncbi:MAG: Hint domain-containing protein [Pseudomonadota bacterium]